MESNYFHLAAAELVKARPQDFVVNADTVKEVEAKCAATRKAALKANPPEAVPARVEYNAVRKQLYDLTEHAKNCEIRLNNEAGNVSHFLTLISDLLKKKKAAITDNRLGDERFCEHQLVKAEEELQDARERLTKEQRYNQAAVRALRNFDPARLVELKAELAI